MSEPKKNKKSKSKKEKEEEQSGSSESHELEVKGQPIKCCMCVPVQKIVTALLVVAILESFYILYNIMFSFIYYSVGKSQEVTVGADGQLVTGNKLTNLTSKKS
jgi:hypothetical protein